MNPLIEFTVSETETGSAASVLAPGRKTALPHEVRSFSERLALEIRRVNHTDHAGEWQLKLPPDDEVFAERSEPEGALSVALERLNAASGRYSDFEGEMTRLASELDFSDPATMVRIVEHQAHLSAAQIDFEFIVQAGAGVKQALTTLLREQN